MRADLEVSVSLQAVTFDLSCCHLPTDETPAFSRLKSEAPAHMTPLAYGGRAGQLDPFTWHNLAFDPFNVSLPSNRGVLQETPARASPSRQALVVDAVNAPSVTH